jgi:hypothetical protein
VTLIGYLYLHGRELVSSLWKLRRARRRHVITATSPSAPAATAATTAAASAPKVKDSEVSASAPDSDSFSIVFDRHMLKMSSIFGLQALEKHFLAEGEKMVLVSVESAYSQGVYGLVSNLGSLVARLVFQPIEEAAFTVRGTNLGTFLHCIHDSEFELQRVCRRFQLKLLTYNLYICCFFFVLSPTGLQRAGCRGGGEHRGGRRQVLLFHRRRPGGQGL